MPILPSMTTTTSLRHFSVSSPQYTQGYYWGDEPPESGCNYAWVMAKTKREAKILAVKAWGLQDKKGLPWLIDWGVLDFGYCDDRALNPFKGLKVEEMEPCRIHGFGPEKDGGPYSECKEGKCYPYTCVICDSKIEPIGSEVSNPHDSVYGDDTWAHALCLLPESKHAEIVYGDEYFA